MKDFAVIGASAVRSRHMVVGKPVVVGGTSLIGAATSAFGAVVGVVDPVGVLASPAATKQFAQVLAGFLAAGLALGIGGHYAIRAFEKQRR